MICLLHSLVRAQHWARFVSTYSCGLVHSFLASHAKNFWVPLLFALFGSVVLILGHFKIIEQSQNGPQWLEITTQLTFGTKDSTNQRDKHFWMKSRGLPQQGACSKGLSPIGVWMVRAQICYPKEAGTILDFRWLFDGSTDGLSSIA